MQFLEQVWLEHLSKAHRHAVLTQAYADARHNDMAQTNCKDMRMRQSVHTGRNLLASDACQELGMPLTIAVPTLTNQCQRIDLRILSDVLGGEETILHCIRLKSSTVDTNDFSLCIH